MSVATTRILRESLESLQIIMFAYAVAWTFLRAESGRKHPWALPALVTVAYVWFLFFSEVTGDIRAPEVFLLLVGVILPTHALARLTGRPGALGLGRGTVAVLLPSLAVAWMLARAFALPSIACAQHLADHAAIHRQWHLEYRALLELERIRAEKTGSSRLMIDAQEAAPSSEVEILEAEAPPGGWAYTAAAIGCENCRTFYMDSNEKVTFARRRRPTSMDKRVHWNEVEYLRYVIENGCFVLGDVHCR